MIRRVVLLLTLAACACTAFAETAHWPQFRGTDGVPSVAAARIPDEFGPDRNARWSQPVPPGHSSPVIWGDRLYLTGHEDGSLMVLAYRRTDGKPLWRRSFDPVGDERLLHRDATPAAPTPATDGRRVYAYFGAYGLVALNSKGKVVWEKKFPLENNEFGTGSSPILHDGTVYLVRDVAGLSAVHAFDAASGKQRWMTPRPEAGSNFATPYLWRHAGGTEIVVAGSSTLKAYDAATGKPVWWVNGLTALACPSPTASGNVLYFAGWSTPNVPSDRRLATGFPDDVGLTDEILAEVSRFVDHLDDNGDGKLQREELPDGRAKDAFSYLDFDRSGAWDREEIQGLLDSPAPPGKNLLVAVKAGGSGDVTDSHVLWRRDKGLPYVASPLLHGGRLYYVKKGGFASAINAASGEPYYEAQRLGIGGEYYASPVGVGNRVYVATVRGTLLVLGTGDELEIVARNDLGAGIFATPAVVGDTLYVRTAERLWAFGEEAVGR